MIKLVKPYFYITFFFIFGSFVFSYLQEIKYISFQTVLIILSGPVILLISKSYYYLLRSKNTKQIMTKFSCEKQFKLDLSTPLKICFLLSIVYFFFFISYNAEFSDIFSIPRQIAYRRYTNNLVMPLILKVLRIFLTTGTVIASFELFRSSSTISKLYVVLILFDGLMSAGKAGPLIGFLFYFTTYFVLRILYKKPVKILSLRNIFYLACFFIFILLIQFFRLKEYNFENFIYVLLRFFSYAFAGLNAFDFWLSNYSYNFHDLHLGLLTFEGFFDIIGVRDRVQGVFQEGVSIGDLPPTNIFTGYRILLMDFGPVGFMLFLFINGIFLFFSLNMSKQYRHHWIPIFTMTLSFYLWIFFASIYSSNTYLFGILISSIIIWIKQYLKFKF